MAVFVIIYVSREIMDLANHLVYNGKLQCGTESIAKGRLNMPFRPQPSKMDEWLWQSLDPDKPVLFLDTDSCQESQEMMTGGQVTNPYEAKLVALLVKELLEVRIHYLCKW